MSGVMRVLMVVVGGLLLLPGVCSAVFTPKLLISVSGRDPLGIGDAAEFFTLALYCVSVGYALALGGVWLIRRGTRQGPPVAAPGWLLATMGVLLLMPGVSILLDWFWGYLARALEPTNPQWGTNFTFVILAPVFVAIGGFLLWHLRQRSKMPAGPCVQRAAQRALIAIIEVR